MYRSNEHVRQRIKTLSWSVPLFLALVVLAYQLGLARWVHDNYGDPLHFGIEILFFGTTGPLITFWALKRIVIFSSSTFGRDTFQKDVRDFLT